MRIVKYSIEKSSSGKTVGLVAIVEDRFGCIKISLTKVRGWRSELALKHLRLEQQRWSDDVARAYIGIEALKCAKNEHEALKFLGIVKELSRLEIHFWSAKFLNGNKKARKAWRSLYG